MTLTRTNLNWRQRQMTFRLIWNVIRHRPVIAYCDFIGPVMLGPDNDFVIMVGNSVRSTPPPLYGHASTVTMKDGVLTIDDKEQPPHQSTSAKEAAVIVAAIAWRNALIKGTGLAGHAKVRGLIDAVDALPADWPDGD